MDTKTKLRAVLGYLDWRLSLQESPELKGARIGIGALIAIYSNPIMNIMDMKSEALSGIEQILGQFPDELIQNFIK